MTYAESLAPEWRAMTPSQRGRWDEVARALFRLLPDHPIAILIDGEHGPAAILADRLTAALHVDGRPCSRLTGDSSGAGAGAQRTGQSAAPVTLADAARSRACGRWEVVIRLRTRATYFRPPEKGLQDETAPGITIDVTDPAWPVIRDVAASLGGDGTWYIAETRAFFACRATTWDTKFGDDSAAYAAAVAQAGIFEGGVVVDVGCGTGRALPALRQAVGPHGAVIGLDLTPEMLAEARAKGRDAYAGLVLADARRLPLADASVDAVFAAGLVMHFPDIEDGLAQLGRITRPGGLLVLFHPSGRAALAARHGRVLRPDERLAHAPLQQSLQATGWRLTTYDDPPHRFLAIATRPTATASRASRQEES